MRRLPLLALFLSLSILPAASAQTVSVYATANPTYLNHLYTISGGSTPTFGLSGQWLIGAGGGVTINFPSSGPVSFGLDFRGGPEIGTPGIGTALAGVKMAFKSPAFRFKPYAQLSTGFLEQRHNTGSGAYASTNAASYLAFELFGGVDYPIARHVDLRIVELGAGLTHIVVNNGDNTAFNPQVLSVSSGLVFNF